MFDYDLYDQGISPDEYPYNGSGTARVIAPHVFRDVPVLVQSMNLSRGTEMQQVLEVTTFSATCSPFKWLT
jgi:hypothetical protein